MNIGQRTITDTTTLENCLAESMGSKINAFFMAMQFHCKVYTPPKKYKIDNLKKHYL